MRSWPWFSRRAREELRPISRLHEMTIAAPVSLRGIGSTGHGLRFYIGIVTVI